MKTFIPHVYFSAPEDTVGDLVNQIRRESEIPGTAEPKPEMKDSGKKSIIPKTVVSAPEKDTVGDLIEQLHKEPEAIPEEKPEEAPAAEPETSPETEPEPQAEPEHKPEPQPLPNKFRPEKPAARPEVKPAPKPEKPPVKKPEPYRPAPAKPKKKAPDAQRQSHKAGVLLTVLIICAAVLAVLLLRSLGVFGTPSAAETTPTPAPTAPVETAVPTETPTPTPKPEPTYEVVKADVSWADAEAAAEAKGGHLVVIDSAEKWTRVAQLADESGLTYVWIGLYRADSGELAWVKDNIDPVYNWAAGEPSVRDTNGAAENYVLIARRSDGWYYNDCIGDPAAKYPQFYGGKTGYIIEIDP